MRTTLDIADDLLFAAKDFARRDKKTLGQVVSDLLRQALAAPPAQAMTLPSGAVLVQDEAEKRFRALGFCPLPSRGRPVSNEHIDALREQEGI
ncbi:MAG: hypothetical protein RLZZ401_694 [Pseudomonadota bacterium]